MFFASSDGRTQDTCFGVTHKGLRAAWWILSQPIRCEHASPSVLTRANHQPGSSDAILRNPVDDTLF